MDADAQVHPDEGDDADAGAARAVDRAAATTAARLALELARAQEGRMAFLARASMALGSSLESSATADHVARLAVPQLGDLCLIDLVRQDGTVYRSGALDEPLGGAERLARLLADSPAPQPGSPQTDTQKLGRIRLGLIADDSETWSDDTELHHLRDLGLLSYLILPLRSRGNTVGVLSLFSTRQRAYAAEEFATAGEFAARASVALDNALLYEDAVQARSLAEAARRRTELLISGLRDSERRYRTLFEESRDAIYVTARDGRFIDANSAALELFGYPRAELMHINARDLYVQPERREEFSSLVEESGSVRDFEATLRRKSGEPIECLLSSMVRRDIDGDIVGYQGIIRDITERKRAERRILESEHFTRAIISSVRQGIIVYDGDLRYQVWNRFMEEMTGLAADQIVGLNALDSLPALREHGVDELLQRALSGETVYSPDMPLVIPETRRSCWVSAVYSPHVSLEGNVIGVVAIIHDITERKRAEDQLIHSAFHDPLTNLPNRALFVDRLERLLRHRDRHPEFMFGVAFLDLDRFKTVNDSLGHMIGDDLLVSIARRLESCVRGGDTVARFGGDEFAVLLDDVTDVRDATRVAERILLELGVPFRLSGHEVFTSASIGIALSSAGYERPEDILRDADAAMYRAKTEGRSRYQVFDQGMHQLALDSMLVESELERALRSDELRLHYQPIIALDGGRISGFEALIRWEHPERGLLAPAEFLPVAENSDLIVEIGWWVLDRACDRISEWRRRFPEHGDLFVSVNLSSRHFAGDMLPARIDACLERAALPPSALKLEISELLLTRSDPAFTATLAALRQRGIRLCIDDFGTGSSSLEHLHAFPVDTLKIDRSFIARIGFGGSSDRLVETLLTLGEKLGMASVAEGVETPEQLEFLRQLGPQFAQGYLFSSARTPDEIEQLLARSQPE
jgi:diguanylate cyclase (GGDEF)-like protein/PAS domain S-box-containing protein